MERYFVLDKYNTWYDWRLILTAKDVTPPEPKTNYVNLDGMDGTLDLSEALTGEITYNDRTITARFWTDDGTRQDRERLLQTITAALHGKKIKIIEPDDPDHYFYGRAKIKSIINIIPYAEFEIEIICEPWRYAIDETNRTIALDTGETDIVVANNGVKTVYPVVTVAGGSVSLTFKGVSVTLSSGVYKLSDLKLYAGNNIVTGKMVYVGPQIGLPSVTFTYREAVL